jgi:hypothetical protein
VSTAHSGGESVIHSVMYHLNLVFLCGSLEPGKDGVGDYTRRLASHLIQQGSRASIIAINDRHVASCRGQHGSIALESQECDGLSVPVLRLASYLSWRKRLGLIQGILDIQNPQWISLQYVPHAYSRKGIPFRLPYHLKQVKYSSRWHVMFHELWGAKETQPLLVRRAVTGAQRRIVAALNRTLPISVAHTSTDHWRNLLECEDVESTILPLISNIPVAIKNNSTRESLLATLDIFEPDSKALIITFFGTIRFDWSSMGLVDRVHELLKQSPWTHAVFVSIGSAGEAGEIIWRGMESRASNHCHFLKLGKLPPEQISQILQLSDVGVAMNYLEHVGKSGSVAAMIQHGLPVILPEGGSDSSHSSAVKSHIRPIPFDHNFESALLSSSRFEPSDSVNEIALALASSLSSSQ